MSSPPITGNNDLDAYLYNLQLGIETAGMTSAGTIPVGEVNATFYPEKYIQVRYADSDTGENISNSPVGRKYYGIYNSPTITASDNPADYTWFLVANGGFGSSLFLFYTVTFGRNLKLYIADVAPTINWNTCPITYIDLDIISDGKVNNQSFETAYEPIKVVDTLPDPSTYSGPSIIYVTSINKMYRYSGGQWTSNVLTADLEGTLGFSNFSNSLRPVEVVSTLPTTGNFVGRTAVLTTNSKLYRYGSGGWSAAVPTNDLTGVITTDQLDANSVTTGKLAVGAVTADILGTNSVIAGKIQAGSVDASKINVSQLSAISANMGDITAGTINISGNFIVDSAGNVTIRSGSLNINNRFIVNTDGSTTIQSATSGARTVITNSSIRVYDAGGTLRVKIGDLA